MDRIYILIDKRAVNYGTDFGEDVIIHVDATSEGALDFAKQYFESLDDCGDLGDCTPDEALEKLAGTGEACDVFLINRSVHNLR